MQIVLLAHFSVAEHQSRIIAGTFGFYREQFVQRSWSQPATASAVAKCSYFATLVRMRIADKKLKLGRKYQLLCSIVRHQLDVLAQTCRLKHFRCAA